MNNLRSRILATATKLAHLKGYQYVYLTDIARKVPCSKGSVVYHFGTMTKLRAAIIQHGIEHEDMKIISQGLGSRHPLALKCSEGLRRKAALGLV